MLHGRSVALPRRDCRIEFNREPGAEFLGFRKGDYDFVSALDPEWVQALRDDEDGAWKPEWQGKFEVHQVPYLKTDYIGFLVDSVGAAGRGLSCAGVPA